MYRSILTRGAFGLFGLVCLFAEQPKTDLPLVFKDDFSKGAAAWEPTDPNAWKVIATKSGSAFSQHQQSKFKPPHRSPLNFALIKDVSVSDFVLDAKVLSTTRDYGHRDVCLFFGYQNPTQYYYVHLGKETDDRANQIFIVNKADRVKISTETTKGTPWDNNWHHVRVVRKVEDGTIEVYFDDMKKPVMRAKDKTFAWGRVGIGSFDDTSDWTDVVLHGKQVEKK